MSRHLADQSTESGDGRMEQFIRIARSESSTFWQKLWQNRPAAPGNRRVQEFIRIERAQAQD